MSVFSDSIGLDNDGAFPLISHFNVLSMLLTQMSLISSSNKLLKPKRYTLALVSSMDVNRLMLGFIHFVLSLCLTNSWTSCIYFTCVIFFKIACCLCSFMYVIVFCEAHSDRNEMCYYELFLCNGATSQEVSWLPFKKFAFETVKLLLFLSSSTEYTEDLQCAFYCSLEL